MHMLYNTVSIMCHEDHQYLGNGSMNLTPGCINEDYKELRVISGQICSKLTTVFGFQSFEDFRIVDNGIQTRE